LDVAKAKRILMASRQATEANVSLKSRPTTSLKP
jgi:hypothetical protein